MTTLGDNVNVDIDVSGCVLNIVRMCFRMAPLADNVHVDIDVTGCVLNIV